MLARETAEMWSVMTDEEKQVILEIILNQIN
jgi:predicted Fe-S protein YdhL (DUF1289 family)